MVFGVLEVFGINDVSSDMRIYSDEICKVSLSEHFVETEFCTAAQCVLCR